MHEEYLHFLWSKKRLLTPQLETTDGQPFSVRSFGIHNTLMAGPDFKHAVIQMDGLEFHGSIEFHVKSSDWYAHGHQNDEAYNNVILHVVYEHDMEVVQQGRTLPVFVIQPHVDLEHYQKYVRFKQSNHTIVCGSQLAESDPIFLASMINKALCMKWQQKIQTVLSHVPEDGEPMYYFLGAAFGGNLNTHSFLELLRKIPEQKVKAMNPANRYQLLLSESGMFQNRNSEGEPWHFKGNRPRNFPPTRLRQFAQNMCDDELILLAELESSEEIVRCFYQIFDRPQPTGRLTKSFQNHVLINAVVPYFVYLATKREEDDYLTKAEEILKILPTEQNAIVKEWKRYGQKVKNAYDSQGLLALYRYYCTAKKCVSCEVSRAILST